MRRFAAIGVITVVASGCVEESRTREARWCVGERSPQRLLADVKAAHAERFRELRWVVHGESRSNNPFDVEPYSLGYGDVDHDGVPDHIWQVGTTAIGVQVSGAAFKETAITPWYPTADTLSGVILTEFPTAIVLTSRTQTRRYRWDDVTSAFVPASQLGAEFEDAFRIASARETAVRDDETGGFGKRWAKLDRCVGSTPEPNCQRLVSEIVGVLVEGGVDERIARDDLNAYLGWRACAAGMR